MELPLVARKSVSFIPTAEYLRKLARKQCKKDVIDNILQGSLGIPKTVAEYVHRVLQYDIYELIGARNVVEFYRFMRTIAGMNGMVVNYVHIADSVDVTPNTIKQWVKFLEGTGTWFNPWIRLLISASSSH